MIGIIYHYINLLINIYLLTAVYYYCIKTYGIKVTAATNLCLSSFALTGIFTGMYSVADIKLAPFFTVKIGDIEFWATDPINIFVFFIVIFELARFSLKKMKGTDLNYKDILCISILVTIFGIFFQLLIDPTAAALGLYYYRNPPSINIFGFPIWFITAFATYGFYAFIFLIIERYYFQKNCRSN